MSNDDDSEEGSFLGQFLEVILLAFASMLVLGLIFSITAPPAPNPAPTEPVLQFRLFQFTEEGATEQTPPSALGPEVSYIDEKQQKHQVPVSYLENENRWVVERPEKLPPGLEISFIGFSRYAEQQARENTTGSTDSSSKQIWAVLFTGIPPGYTCDAQAYFIDRMNESAKTAPLQLRRTVTPIGTSPASQTLVPGPSSNF